MQAISPKSGEGSRPTGKFLVFENYFQAIERRPSKAPHESFIYLQLPSILVYLIPNDF